MQDQRSFLSQRWSAWRRERERERENEWEKNSIMGKEDLYRERERARIVRDEDEKMWNIVLFVLYVEVVVCWIEYLCCMNKVHT